jgi:hypothetical protein
MRKEIVFFEIAYQLNQGCRVQDVGLRLMKNRPKSFNFNPPSFSHSFVANFYGYFRSNFEANFYAFFSAFLFVLEGLPSGGFFKLFHR